MGTTSRRKFLRYGVSAAVLASLGGLSAYFLTRRPEQPSTTGSTSGIAITSSTANAPSTASGASSTLGLPPGQSEVDSLEVLHIDGIPEIKLDEWAFDVYGEVENPFKVTWSQFLQLPRTIAVSEFDCVTGWTKLDNRWEGVRFKEIAEPAHLTVKAKYATIECYGNPTYTTSLPLGDFLRDDVLFAYGLDGKQLEPVHGGPLRLVVPRKYGYKSAKWVKRVKFTEKQELGFWESNGYSNTADPWTNDRYA